MKRHSTFAIVGAGLAGAKAAEALRTEGYEGRVVLIGDEDEHPYERPPLSKDYLRGEAEREKAHVHGPGFYESNAIEHMPGRSVAAIDDAAHTLLLDGDETLGYDRLLLATGARPRRLEIPGAGLAGVHYLRTLADADALREALAKAGHVVVVGAGWIGSEVAASARKLGVEVTVVEPSAVPLERVLGHEVGRVYFDLHSDNGVRLLTGTGVERFDGDGVVEAVRTTDGRSIECDAVVAGIGAVPRVELAAEAGILVDDGVLTDVRLRTSSPDVFAAGDVASAEHPLYAERVRVEHWANALNQGKAAARNMLGRGDIYDRLPYFYSDQYDLGMEYSGLARDWDEVVFRGDPHEREFIAFWLKRGRVLAGMNANVWDVTDAIQALIRSGAEIDAGLLADPDVPLESISADSGERFVH
jgi:3-phenylpropionate/trans-cinnamate dioxygenase ferredoxin reductase subunit